MNCNRYFMVSQNVLSPVLPEAISFEEMLFGNTTGWMSKQQFDMKHLMKSCLSEVRRMNRTSGLAFKSADEAMKCFHSEEKYDSFRFGTAFSTTNASFESVLRVLNCLYEKGMDYVSPIDFTYSVGNSLISGITKKYQLKGPSILMPSSEPVLSAQLALERDEADYMMVGSYNICLDENLDYYHKMDYLNGAKEECTKMLSAGSGITVREQAVTLILSSDNKNGGKKGCCMYDVAVTRKERAEKDLAQKYVQDSAYSINSVCELSSFSEVDFVKAMRLALQYSKKHSEEIDVVFTSICGHKNKDIAEYDGVKKMFPNAVQVSVQGMFGGNLGSSFLMNCAAALESMRHQSVPASYGVSNKYTEYANEPTAMDIKIVLVNGYDELGNIVSGVLEWI